MPWATLDALQNAVEGRRCQIVARFTVMSLEVDSIHEAVRNGDVAALRRALDSGILPDAAENGYSPLHWLCSGFHGGDRVACVKLLIERGANVNAVTSPVPFARPLQFAIYSHSDLVPLLLDAGADPNLTDDDDRTALHHALRSPLEPKAVVQALISAGADVNLRDKSGETPLDGAQLPWGIFLKILPILFRAGALPTRTDIAYVRKIRAAGGFKRYERIHLNAITATFAPKFSHLLPPELVRRVVEYAFHVGDY